jgi:hypothetical protein
MITDNIAHALITYIIYEMRKVKDIISCTNLLELKLIKRNTRMLELAQIFIGILSLGIVHFIAVYEILNVEYT